MDKVSADNFIIVGKSRILNTNFIRWISERNNCYEICSKQSGCSKLDTDVVCMDSKHYQGVKQLFTDVMSREK